mgnify:CR=1 FL=1
MPTLIHPALARPNEAVADAPSFRHPHYDCEDLPRGLRLTVYVPGVDAHGVEISSRGPDLVVTADPSRLRQLVVNVLDNAARHSPPGTSVRISGATAPDGWWLEVSATSRTTWRRRIASLHSSSAGSSSTASRASHGVAALLPIYKAWHVQTDVTLAPAIVTIGRS